MKAEKTLTRLTCTGTVSFSCLAAVAALFGAPLFVNALLFLPCLAAALIFCREAGGKQEAKQMVQAAAGGKFLSIPGCILIFLFAPDLWTLLLVLTGAIVLTGIVYARALYAASKERLLQGDVAFMMAVVGFFIIWDLISALFVSWKMKRCGNGPVL